MEEVREQRRLIQAEQRERQFKEKKAQDRNTSLQSSDPVRKSQQSQAQVQSQPRFYQIKAGEEFRSFGDVARKKKMQKYIKIILNYHYVKVNATA